MKPLKVAEARARFGEMLDQAEQGAPVIIERKGVLFRLAAETPAPQKPDRGLFSFVDADVLAGQWTWTSGRKGLAFAPRAARKKR